MSAARLTHRLIAAAALAGWTLVTSAATQEAAPRRLLVSVAQDTNADGTRRSTPDPGSRVWDTRTHDNRRVLQTVQVLEGRSAFILVGQSRAVPQRGVARTIVGGQVVEHVVDGVDYRNADTGFYVLPRVSGDRVTLEITAQREVFVPGRGANVDQQRTSTTVSGRLGEWIEVASSSEERGSERETVLGRAGTLRNEARAVLLKVDVLP